VSGEAIKDVGIGYAAFKIGNNTTPEAVNSLFKSKEFQKAFGQSLGKGLSEGTLKELG
jgi:hypothetical protein